MPPRHGGAGGNRRRFHTVPVHSNRSSCARMRTVRWGLISGRRKEVNNSRLTRGGADGIMRGASLVAELSQFAFLSYWSCPYCREGWSELATQWTASVVAAVIVCAGICVAGEVSTKEPVARDGKVEIGVRVGESMRLSGRLGRSESRVSDKISGDGYDAGDAGYLREEQKVEDSVSVRKVSEPAAVLQQRAAQQAQRDKQLKVRRMNAAF